MTLFAKLVAQEEGFGVPGKIPTIRHNPGDLRHSPHSEHPGGPAHAEDVGTIDTDADGWADLERQLQIWAKEGLTIRQAITLRQAPSIENDSERYLNFICAGLKLPPETPMSQALKIQA